MDLDHVVKEIAEGRLVQVVFLTPRGRQAGLTGEHPCLDARAKSDRFAFMRCFAPCAHAVDAGRIEQIGDEMYLHGEGSGMDLRVEITPVWLPVQREILSAWRAERDGRLVSRELARVLT